MSEQSPLQGVAIVGAAGRFPGASSAKAFWDNIKAGVESISFFSDAELTAAGQDAAALRADPEFVAARGIIDRPEWFDAQFFGMTPIEAEATDPQQRVLLEVAWEALEEAGYDVSRYPGSIGVYAGVATNTYYLNVLLARPDVLKAIGPMQAMIGREKDFVATRVAYKLNLKGPAINVNSACSTSLVAVCQAVQALLTYQCDMALAGGATIVLPQHTGYLAEDEGITSPDGHTRTFDADARGTAFSNGAALVVLKRLEDAVADGDHIYAVIKGAALNNDGSDKASFMAPSAKGHAEVIAMAHALAGVDPRTIGYVEAHGTATPIGDPIEVEGLTEAFRSGTPDTGFCAIGSVKTNVGHLEVAAGVAGLIKTAFCLHERLFVPSLHYQRPNPRIDFAASPFFVNTSLRPWASDGPRRAGVSSFGIGGTNAHVVLEEPPPLDPSAPGQGPYVFLVSAKTPTALGASAANLADYLSANAEVNLADVAFTLHVGRRAFPHRLAVVGHDAAEVAGKLRHDKAAMTGYVVEPRSAAFLFSGPGTRTRRPRFDLVESEPVFADAISRVIAAAPSSITASLASGTRPSAANDDGSCDPFVYFAWQYATAELLRSWGLTPGALAGQNTGVLAAACVAGVMSLGDAVRVLAEYVEASTDDGRWLRALRSVTLSLPRVPVASNTTVGWISDTDAVSPEFWARQIGSTDAALSLGSIVGRRDLAPVELGLERTFADLVTQRSADVPVASVDLAAGSDQSDRDALLAVAAALWVAGCDVDWTAISGPNRRRVALPTYCFERKRFYADPKPVERQAGIVQTDVRASEPAPANPTIVSETWQVLPISADSAEALSNASTALASTLVQHPDRGLDRVLTELRSQRAGRTRRAIVARSASEAAHKLLHEPLAEQIRSAGPLSPSVIFMFAGGGAQYAGAAHGLFRNRPAFRRAVETCCTFFDTRTARDVLRLIDTPPAAISAEDRSLAERPSVGLPLLFAVESGLVELWRTMGVMPVALIGHSLGEYTAAYVSGVLSLEDAAGLVETRGRLFDGLARGSMMAVPAAPAAVARYLGKELDIAAINAPSSCVISGPVEAIERAAAALQADDIDAVPLHINVAAHSSMVEPIVAAFGERVRKARLHPPTVPFVSNVTGDWITEAEATNPDYWVRHLRQTVRFADGVATLARLAQPLFLEVGPGRVLSSLVKGHPALPADASIVQTVRHPSDERDDQEMFVSAAARLWVSGVEIDWNESGEREKGRAPMSDRRVQEVSAVMPVAASAPVTSGPVPASAVPVQPQPAREPRPVRVAAKLRDILQELGGIDASTLGGGTSFVELGFDSLSLTQVAQGVRKAFGVRIRFRQLLEAIPTIDALAAYIDREMPPDPIAPPAPAPVAASAPIVSVHDSRTHAPTPVLPAIAAPALSGGSQTVEEVIRVQLALMAEQLEVLKRAVGEGRTALPAPAPIVQPNASATPSAGAVPGSAPAQTSTPASSKRFGPYVPPDTRRRELTDQQQRALDAFIARYTARTRGSKALTDEQRPTLADARAVTGFKAQWKEIVYQIAMARSSGSRMVDVDGNEYVDFTMNFGASLFGHSPAFLTEAVERQLRTGIDLGTLSPLAAPVSQALARITGMERVAFANTGTDAIMGALRAARTVTGRDNVITFRGGYHGMNDEVLAQSQGSGEQAVVLPAVPGVPPHAVAGTIVLDYDDPDCLDQLRRHLPDAAAVLIEPIQSRRPGYDAGRLFGPIRQLTREAGVAMIFDELITGFRMHPRGAQGWFGVDVDLATYGKILGNGMPVAAIAGRAEFMEAFDGGVWRFGDDSQPEGNVTFYGGTHTRHPLGLAAAQAVLRRLEEEGPALQERLNARTAGLCARINMLLEQRGVSIRLDHVGSMFLFRFPSESDPGRGRASLESSAGTLERLLFYYLREKGIHIWDRPGFLSTAHTDEDLDRFVAAVESAVDEMLAAGFLATTDVQAAVTAPVAGATETVPRGSLAAMQVPLSAGQKEIWLAAQVGEGGSLAFNQCISLVFDGPLDANALRRAVEAFVTRHDALRMTFDEHGEWQRVHPSIDLPFTSVDFSGLDEATFESRLQALIEEDSTTPFDLARGPLCRFTLVRRSATRHVLVFDAHHIICDGWSVTTFVEELGPIYRAMSEGHDADLPPAAKFSDWVRATAAADAREDEAYWLQQFAAPVPALEMPVDRPRPPVKTYRAGTSITRAAGEPVDTLRRASAEAGTTMFVGVLSAYAVLLHTLSGQSDLVVGCAAAGQNGEDEASLVGHCVSLLPVRLQVNPTAPVSDLLAHVRRQVLDAFDHQSYTYGQLIEKLHVRRDASRQPLLSTLITYEVDSDQMDFGPVAVRVEAHPRRFCNFEVELHVRATRHDLLIWLYFHPDLFDQETVDRWTSYLVRVIGELGADPRRLVGLVPVMPDDERHRVLVDWNQTRTSEPTLTLQSIDQRAAEHPERVAIEDDRGNRLTRGELASRSDRIARHLLAAGAAPGTVGLCVSRSIDMPLAVLGILKAGGAYLPLDAALPAARLSTMIDDADVTSIVASRALAGTLPASNRRVLVLEDLLSSEASSSPASLPAVAGSSSAYVIYTSGSTGQPKGVVVTHANLANLLQSIAREPGFTERDTLLAVTTLSFDVATAELLLPLVAGGRLVIASQEVAADGTRLRALMDRVKPTFMHPTPVTWRLLLEAGWTGSPDLVIGSTGEALPRELAERLVTKGRALWNLYGPTETTIWSTIHQVRSGSGIVPIGRPVANTTTYVLNAMRQPVPVGVRGELYIGGDGVATGYLHRPELTADRFIPDPFSSEPGARLYRTGDAARYRADGTLECLERLDHQVKLRGFRIELGEIEAVLQSHPGVTAAVVVLREDAPGDPRLVAYVTPGTVDVQAIRTSARGRLPEYMVPAVIVPQTTLPQTASGKIDRKALPAPETTSAVRETTAPRTATEARLVEIWREVLKTSHVGVHDNFFDLGGHSLLAVRLVMRIKERLGREMPFGALLSHPTVAELAAYLEPETPKPVAVVNEPSAIVTLQPNGADTPIFFVHGIDGDVWGFVELARAFNGQRPVYGLQSSQDPKEGTTVQDMAEQYLREIKRIVPEGPYLLGGFCSGAAVAYEMAQQLRARGDRVGLLAVIDYGFFDTIRRPWFGGAVVDFIGNLGPWIVEDAVNAGPRAIVGRALSKARLFWAKLTSGSRTDGDVRDRLGLWRYPDHQVKMLEIYAKAFDTYTPRPYDGRVTLFRARTNPLFGRQPQHDLGWGRVVTGGVDINLLRGSHDTILKPPFVADVAARLRRAIAQAPASSPIGATTAAHVRLSSSAG